MKYFLLGAFASGFFLYGIALIFGATGHHQPRPHRQRAWRRGPAATRCCSSGSACCWWASASRSRSVPFHMWAPDVYEGAPTSVTAFIATGSKAAAFAALLRVLLTALRGAPGGLADARCGCWPSLTMTVGNVVALAQQNLKRMLAYSSIAHVGYMLVGVVAGGALGQRQRALLPARLHLHDRGRLRRDPPAGAGRAGGGARSTTSAGSPPRHPVLAVALSVFLLSLVGIPPTAGFVGKFYLFGAAVQAGLHRGWP